MKKQTLCVMVSDAFVSGFALDEHQSSAAEPYAILRTSSGTDEYRFVKRVDRLPVSVGHEYRANLTVTGRCINRFTNIIAAESGAFYIFDGCEIKTISLKRRQCRHY